MNLKASNGRFHKECLSKFCRSLKMDAICADEAEFLSAMFGVLMSGGSVEVTKADGTKYGIVFPSQTAAESSK